MPSNRLRVFKGATVIITGGASGIGRALGEALVKRGSEVVLADLQLELAEKVASQMRAAGGRAEAAQVDVTDFAAVTALVQRTVERTGRLDYMFNNAGINILGPASRYTIEDWERMIDVNLRGVVNGVQAVYPLMLKQGFGHIVNTASISGLILPPGAVSYAATKFAVVGLSTALRLEAASEGVQVSVLCPGIVRTPILKGSGKYGKNLIEFSPRQEQDFYEQFQPMPPDEFAQEAIAAIANNEAIIVIPSWWQLFWWINRLSPSLAIVLTQMFYETRKRVLNL